MNTVGKFENVSLEQFKSDFMKQNIETMSIQYPSQLPQRSTYGSAGYDFIAPFDIKIPYGQSMVIPTGVKCAIREDWFLALFPRSGQGFKFGIEIANTVGIIDSDYYDNDDNEGHIMVKITNKDISIQKDFEVKVGQAFCQGIFLPYGVTVDDDKTNKSVRTGGVGSTGGVN